VSHLSHSRRKASCINSSASALSLVTRQSLPYGRRCSASKNASNRWMPSGLAPSSTTSSDTLPAGSVIPEKDTGEEGFV
jgi:hypothetical protein